MPRSEAEKARRRRWKQGYLARKRAKEIAGKDAANHVKKIHYADSGQAELVMARLPLIDGDHVPMQVYPCPICGLFLIGHKPYDV